MVGVTSPHVQDFVLLILHALSDLTIDERMIVCVITAYLHVRGKIQ